MNFLWNMERWEKWEPKWDKKETINSNFIFILVRNLILAKAKICFSI